MSTWLRKTKGVPGSAPGGLEWHTAEDIVEVEDDILAAELLEIPDAGFVTVPAPEPDPARNTAGGEQQEPEGEPAPAKPARKTAASKAAAKTPVSE